MRRLIALLALLIAPLVSPAAGICINEIMYHPPSTNVLEEWIELFNSDSTNANLSGWKVTKGISFTFPTNTFIPAQGYLVVAANVATFTQLHPTITNVVGGWQGALTDDGEQIQLEDSLGAFIEDIAYAPEGDWALRRISGLDQYNRQSWEWFAPHDGLGSSAELINPNLSSDQGQNWASSITTRGTPGAPNSTASTNISPMIVNISHFPAIPTANDPVVIKASLIDEQTNGLTLTLHWRIDGSTNFTSQPMFDDGAHSDGLPNDRLFAIRLPAQNNKTIIEYYLTATDATGLTRRYPNVLDSGNSRTANLLYQVDNELYSGRTPLYRLIMSRAEYDYLKQTWASTPDSNAEVNGTFIATDGIISNGAATRIFQNASFRNRGHGSRTAVPHNFHIAIPKDNLWQGRDGINLNVQNTASQLLGSELARRAGLIMPESRAVRVRINSEDLASLGPPHYGHCVANEQYESELLERQIPSDPNGNLYRGYRNAYPFNPGAADLAYRGQNFTAYTNSYFKENHKDLNDFSDLIALTDALNNTPDSNYVAAVLQHVNVPAWMRYFAINTLWDNQETAIATGNGDDYGLYRGSIDPRFQLLPYDLDTILGAGNRSITHADGLFRMANLPTISRFIKHPAFAPLYYEELLNQAKTIFSSAQLDPLLDQLIQKFSGGQSIESAVANLRAFNASHRAYILSNIPTAISVTTSLSNINNYAYTTNSIINLSGRAHAARTRQVLINNSPAAWTASTATWSATNINLNPGLNRLLLKSLDATGNEFEQLAYDIWFDNNFSQPISGIIATNTTWTAAAGPYRIISTLSVTSGATLTIEPGTSIYLDANVALNIPTGARLLADGTPTSPIRFTRAPDSTARWSGLNINGEATIRFAHFEFNNSTAIYANGADLNLEALTFGSTDRQYISFDASSFIVRDCVFPTATAPFELAHGDDGIKPGGHAIYVHNFFGAAQGYNDVIDFTGGQRPGPIVHFIDNVFMGSGDDLLDLDGTDAWVEGNIFLHTHRNGSPDSASGVSGGSSGAQTSDVTILNNFFYDIDHAALAKQGNYYQLFNNTIVHQTKIGGLDTDAAVLVFADEGTTEGLGMRLENNLIFDFEKFTRNQINAVVTLQNNSTNDALLTHTPILPETVFNSWQDAQILRSWLKPQPASPARDLGAKPIGIAINGPSGTNSSASATFTLGPGYTQYKWRLDSGPVSAETDRATPIVLTNLSPGLHILEVSGKRDSGLYQDDPRFAPSNPTSIHQWTVDPNYLPSTRTVILNEILAKNISTFSIGATPPDMVELRNTTRSDIDLSGYGLTDDPSLPFKFTFPANTTLPAGAYRTLFADSDTNSPGLHLGFGLDQDGETVVLNHKNGTTLDQLRFGPQIADLSIGRRDDDTWGLCQPTFAGPNTPISTGDPRSLKINEWLANAHFISSDDFVEILNPTTLPIALDGLYISDAPATPTRHQFIPLSFVAPNGLVVYRADGNNSPSHLNFKLAAESGTLHLLAPDLTPIDIINYGPQQTDISQGRSPSGNSAFAFFDTPTPGAHNPGQLSQTNLTFITRPLIDFNSTWRYNANAALPDPLWFAANFNDTAWPANLAPFGLEPSSPYPYPITIRTPLSLTSSGARIKTYYFRAHFDAGTNIAGLTLVATNFIDDGAVFYLNGARVGAIRLSDNPATYLSDANQQNNEGDPDVLTIPTDQLLPGDNVLAVEVHQDGNSSSDVFFALALNAIQTITNIITTEKNPVVLNELLVRTQTLPTPWLELFNPSTSPIDLQNLSLSDSAATPRKFIFPANSIIQPNSYLALDLTNTTLTLPWNGGTLYLFDTPEKGGAPLDAITYGLQTPDFAIGRAPQWTLTIPTRAAPNTIAGLGSPAALRLNEWMADPASGPDWFELFNSDSAPVALAGLSFTDDLGQPRKSPIAPLSFIGAGRNAYIQFLADRALTLGADHVDFRLNRTRSPLGLYAPSGYQIDALEFANQLVNISQGRLPDGFGPIANFPAAATPAAPNATIPTLADTDGDGLLDTYEDQNGLNKFLNDALLDRDLDSLSNYAEFLAGTDPQNPTSNLRLQITPQNQLTFQALANKTYAIESRANLTTGDWQEIHRATPTQNQPLTFPTPITPDPHHFYRLVLILN